MGITIEAQRVTEMTDAVGAVRDVLESLLYRLTTAGHVLASGDGSFVLRALTEVQVVATELEQVDLDREWAAERLADHWGLARGDLTLPWLVARAPEPWSSVLARHRRAIDAVLPRVEQTAAAHRALAGSALELVRARLGRRVGRAVPSGIVGLASPGELRLAEELEVTEAVAELRLLEVAFEAAIDTGVHALPPELLRFVTSAPRLAPTED